MSIREMFQRPERFSPESARSPATPAERARAVMDTRLGSVVVQNYNWRRIALGMLAANILLAAGIVYQSSKSQIIPYVVTVDKATGIVEKAGAVINNDYTPQEAEIKYFLSTFIQNARNIQLDAVQQTKTQNKALAYLTRQAAQKYLSMQESEHFTSRYAHTTVQTRIKSIQKIPDTESYHASWTEEEFTIQNGEQKTVAYEGVFTIIMLPVKDDETLLVNPLGMYISDLNFSRETASINKR